MKYIKRLLAPIALHTLKRGKSILLLGPRQTGKTTFIRQELKPDLEISFVQASARLRYERDPTLLEYELQALIKKHSTPPIIFIDEIQKVPKIMDTVQFIIDKQEAQFILSGSSARKLKHGREINLLPGRVVAFNLAPFTYQEVPAEYLILQDLLLYGSLPGIILNSSNEDRELDLYTYVSTYLEDEIRSEAVVRDLGSFAHFLQLAAGESGKQLNMTKLSQDVGIAATTIANYFQILVDCLVAHKIDPITESISKRRLIKSAKYIFFDLGVRRACANEGTKLPAKVLGDLFEQYIGLQLLAYIGLYNPQIKLRYWRDSAGPEIDYVLEINHKYVPIEVKYSDHPGPQDAKNIIKFLQEYSNSTIGYIVCQTPIEYELGDNGNIKVITYKKLHEILEQFSAYNNN